MATSKTDICNMALSHLGNYGTVNDIDTPTSDKEATFALWYDVTRQAALRLVIPNFAMDRRIVSKRATAPAFGYTYAYEKPSDCLKPLGFNDIDAKEKDNYTIEGEDILTDIDFTDGMELRFIRDVEDVTKFTSDFKILLSYILAAKVAMPITQKKGLRDSMEAMLPMKISEVAGINAQENPPIRVSTSRFRQARYMSPVRGGSKK